VSDEPTTIEYLLKHLQEEISIVVEVEENESSDSKDLVKLLFIVSNNRNPDTFPKIVFKDVTLTFGIPPDVKTINIPRLAPSESRVYEHLCLHSDIPLIKYDIKGSILPESLFQFQTQQRSLSIDKKGTTPAGEYNEFIKELDLHKWVQVIAKVMLPTSGTTLLQLKDQENAYRLWKMEVRNIGQQLQDFSRFQNLSSQNCSKESILEHRKMVAEYLVNVEQGLAELEELYSSQSKMYALEPTKSKVISKLSAKLQKIDEVMNQLNG